MSVKEFSTVFSNISTYKKTNGHWYRYSEINTIIDVECDTNRQNKWLQSAHGYINGGVDITKTILCQLSHVTQSIWHWEWKHVRRSWVVKFLQAMVTEDLRLTFLWHNTKAVKFGTNSSPHVTKEFCYINKQIFDGIVNVV